MSQPNKPYRIPKDQLPCKFDQTWWEDVAGDGGSRMQMFECAADDENSKKLTPEEQLKMESMTKCSPECPSYQPVEIQVCSKHNREFFNECVECMDEYYETEKKVAEEWKKNAPL